MSKFTHIIILAMLTLLMAGCKEKKQDDIIITKKVVKKVEQKGPLAMSESEFKKNVNWVGGVYTVIIVRKPDTSLPMTKDESGKKYYDNRINITVKRADGSTFFNRDFTKENFKEYTNNPFARDGALLGIVLDKAEGDNLTFAASVGSPDTMSDEYIPLLLIITRMGDVMIKKDTQLDTGNGQPRDEVEAAEADGM